MSIITVKNVSKIYGKDKETKVEALKPISFEVNKGDFICIIGTSGSGKSTLLHLLAGVDNVTTGEIIINDKDITTLSNDELALFRRKEIGIIYQFFNLVPALTVRKNIELPVRLDSKVVNQEYLNELVELLKIEDKLNFLPNKLSGGEQQRVAIARALIHKPSIILADEPTGNLNSTLAKEIMDFFSVISNKLNQTIIMITHDLKLANYADRIIEIQDGRIVKDFPTYENMKIEETNDNYINKEDIVERALKKLDIINKDFRENYVDYEGIDKETGNYILNYEKMWIAFTSFTNTEMRASFTKDTIELSDELIFYFNAFRQALKVFDNGNSIILKNFRTEKIKTEFKTKSSFINFINRFDQTGYLLNSRKIELLDYLKEEE